MANGLEELQRATQIYQDIGNEPVVFGYQKQTGSMPILEREVSTGGGYVPPTARTISRPSSRGSYGGSYGSGGGVSIASAQKEYKPVSFQAPDPYKSPAYKPPERDEMVEKKLRREYMGSGMRQIRRATSQAVISSKSMDNPNARSLFIGKALEGVGGAISKVAGTAGREASKEATVRYHDDLNKYHTAWGALRDEAKAKYDSAWQSALMNFQEKQYAARSDMTVEGSDEGVQPVRAYRMSRYGGLRYA